MIRHARLSLLSLLLFAFTLHAKDLPVPSTIQGVKVFLTGAEVTRTGKASLPVGATTLIFSKLSKEVDPNNIQMTGQGAFTILDVRHRLNDQKEQSGKEVKDIEDRIKALKEDMDREQALLVVDGKEEMRLGRNDVVGGDKGATVEQVRAMNEYMQQRLEAMTLSALARQKRINTMNEEVIKLEKQLTEVKGKKPEPTSEVVVEVTCTSAIEAKLTLKYIVRSAGWSPSYDIRVNDISQPLDLTYKAQVYQNTGEDWKDVALALSSGDPTKGASMPVMEPWLLGFGQPQIVGIRYQEHYKPEIRDVRGIIRDANTGEAIPFVNVQLVDAQGNAMNGTNTDFDGYYAIAIPEGGRTLRFNTVGYQQQAVTIYSNTINQSLQQGAELKEVEVVRDNVVSMKKLSPKQVDVASMSSASVYSYAPGVTYDADAAYSGRSTAATNAVQTVVQRVTNFEFAIEVPYTIPSDGQNHHVGVKDHRLTALYKYYCTPKLDLDAFLFAKVTGWEALNLLPGPANVYFEGTYVGQSELDLSVVGDTLDLSLGRDQGVTVQRTKRKDFSKKQTMGSKRTSSEAITTR